MNEKEIVFRCEELICVDFSKVKFGVYKCAPNVYNGDASGKLLAHDNELMFCGRVVV